MGYSFNDLYFGLVEYYHKNDYKLDVHALYKDTNTEELFDLDLCKPILPYGYDEKYFEESLISFAEVLYKTRISWGKISREDALKLKENYIKHYFSFLRYVGINDVKDLESKELYKKIKKQR